MTTALLAIGILALFFVLMSVRLLFIKGGEFKGTCASQSPFLNKQGETCGLCGKKVTPDDDCANPKSEVDKVLSNYK